MPIKNPVKNCSTLLLNEEAIMSDFTYHQGIVMIFFVLAGLGFSILFDIFGMLRKLFRKNKWITFLSDAIFWLIFTIVVYIMNYNLLDGEIKAYAILSSIFGFFLYYMLTRAFIRKFFNRKS